MKKIASIALLLVAGSAWADGVMLLKPVAYSEESSVTPKVREACKIEQRLAIDVGDAMGGTTESTAGRVVRVSIIDVMGVGGGAWSGPKAISLRVELLKDGKVERTTRLTRTTSGGPLGGFKGTCAMLERDSGVLGKDVAKWVESESYGTGEDTKK